MVRPSRPASMRALLLLALCAFCAGQAACAGEFESDPDDLIFRLRNEQPLTEEEILYVNKIARERNLTHQEVADHLEHLWQKSRLLKLTGEPAGPRGTRPLPGAGESSAGASALPRLLGMLAVFTAAAALVYYLTERARIWGAARCAAREATDNRSAAELLAQAQEEASPPDASSRPNRDV